MIYLDYNSHAPLLKSAADAMILACHLDGNPSSVHGAGRTLRKMLDQARADIKQCISAENYNVIFTSGASEANAQIIHTFESLHANIFISAIEHDSILKSTSSAHIVAVDHSGMIDLLALDQMLYNADNTQCNAVSVMAANNETGVIQPIADVVTIAKKYHALVHVDATQAIGRIPVDLNAWGVDYVTCSSHKMGGPLGAGALISRKQANIKSLIKGGAQEHNYRAGTQNVPAIVGFAAALKTMRDFNWYHIAQLRNYMEQALKHSCPTLTIHGENSQRLANTSCLHMPNTDSMTQVMAFDLEGFAISAGSACSSGKVKASSVLTAMGCAQQQAQESVRISLCPETSVSDIEKFISAWQMIYNRTHELDAKNNNTVVDSFSTLVRKVAR